MMRDAKWQGLALAVLVFSAGSVIRARRHPKPANVATDTMGLRFKDVGRELGITFVYRDPELSPLFEGKERLFFFGTGAAVADVDGDGDMDLFFPTPRKGDHNHLYLNEHGRSFREAAQAWEVADNPPDIAITSALFFDYDNDGRPDLYLAGIGCTRLLHNLGGRFEDVSVASGLRDCRNSIGAVPLDLDGDGKLDLYVMRYWKSFDYMHPTTSRVWPQNTYNALDGGENTVYRNLGDGRFRDVTVETAGGDTHWTLDGAWADLEGKGSPQLYLANDFGADVLYESIGGKLVDASKSLGMSDRRFGMGASLGDLDQSGRPALFVTNEYVAGYDQTGNFLWRWGPDGAHDVAPSLGVDVCGWAWGSLFADFDLDGKEDLYVANGFITGNADAPEKADEYYGAVRNDYAFNAGTMMSSPGLLSMDFSNWPKVGTFSYAGHQVDCLFMNRGDRFEDRKAEAGITQDSDGRAVAGIDFDDNGSIDLLVTTQNGSPHFYRNEIDPQTKWIGFSLIGTTSNRDGVGARVEVRQKGTRWYRWATAGKTGFLAGSDPRLHFGIPEGGAVDVTVSWPSGRVDERRGLATGRYYTIEEGSPP